MVGVVEAGRDPEPEDIGGVEVGVVEGVDIGPQRQAEGVGKLMGVRDGGDLGETRKEGVESFGFDGALVHVGTIEGCDLGFIGAGGGLRLGRVLDDAGYPLIAGIRENGEDVETGAVGRKFGPGDVAAVGVEEKVVAGADGGIHVWTA